jgi:hypothetical protein
VSTSQGRLPQHFSVYYWSPAGDPRLSKVDQFRDRFVDVAGVWLPAQRTVTTVTDAGLSTRVLTLADHELRAT